MSKPHEHDGSGITCRHVLYGERKANFICHIPDGTWDFMCGEEDGHETADDLAVICVGCAFENFITGLSPDDIPVGFAADRPSENARWVIRPMTEEELSGEDE